MSARILRVSRSTDVLESGLAAIRAEQDLDPDFGAEVVAAAQAAAAAPRLPDLDRTDLPMITLDPPGAMDLDQAMHLARVDGGYLVHYAIADVGAFVVPGDPVDGAARSRGESLYGADSKIPLHPPALSEGAASLLPDRVRPAFLWTIRLDDDAVPVSANVERARVRSTARWDYEQAQQQIDAGTAGEVLRLLREVGERRIAQEIERGGVNLPMPEQVVDCSATPWRLDFRALLPVEEWNAQISLLTGFAAARIMLAGGVGILRTLPPAPQDAVARLRRTARGLGIDWPASVEYPEFIRGLDPDRPHHLAMVTASTALLRGAAYVGFDGTAPEQPLHAALNAEYAHVTAPLRRLVDRFGLEVCAALCAGEAVPTWVREALPELPALMQASGRRANAYENAVLNLVESAALAGRVGERFRAVVVEADRDDPNRGDVVLREPAVTATVASTAPLPVGEEIAVELVEADPATRRVRFTTA